ncbi:MAG TPA: P-loop NTPase fold protein [Pyrinomonadaceae bacterium]
MVASSQAPTGPEYEQRFLTILNNESKDRKPPTDIPGAGGFVVVVRGGSSLKPLQDLCLDPERQTYNTCFTARYRLQPKMAVGTLLASWLIDVTKMADGQKDLAGDLRLGPSTDRDLESLIVKLSDHPPVTAPTGALTSEFLKRILDYVSRKGVVQAGQRVVLFAELSEAATDQEEWKAAIDILFRRLPERMGIVVSGAPKDFSLPQDDPHFLEITVPDDYGGAAAQGTLAYKYTESSFHSDVPAAKDELDVSRFANAIARFVLHPQTTPPITIGIHGPWGKGKSSFMQLIDSALVKYAEVNRADNTQKWNDAATKLIQAESIQAAIGNAQLDNAGKERRTIEYENLRDEERALWEEMTDAAKKNVLRIRFNAWQFEDAKQTWAGLASEISEQMEALLPRRGRLFLKLKYAWKERRSELILNVLVPLGIFWLVAILFGLGLFRGLIVPKQDSGLGGLLQLILPVGSMLITIWYVSSQFVKVAQPISARVLSYVAMPNYREQMGFQHRVKDDLKFVYDYVSTWLNTSSFNRAGKFRVVVYIDDLDRCSENKIMELLQAINLILADCEFFVFVGMDTEMIYRAIKSYYKGDVPDRFEDNYLSKIIQISFYLPDTKLQTRASYLSTLFSLSSRLELASREATNGQVAPVSAEPPITTAAHGALPYNLSQLLKIVPVQIMEAEDTSYELQAFSDYCDFIDDNPREMKRLINIHRLIKILVQKPDTPLDEGRQKKLVKWLIFCDTWPHLVGNIIELTKSSTSENCLLELARSFAKAEKDPRSTDPVPSYDRLEEFAKFLPGSKKKDGSSDEEITAAEERINEEKKAYTLSAADIDEDFRLAAKLSQMVRKPVRRA